MFSLLKKFNEVEPAFRSGEEFLHAYKMFCTYFLVGIYQ